MAGYLVGLDINDVAAETFSGNASTTAFTLAAAGTTNSTGVYILGVKQVPSTDYSVSGTTLTFTAAPPSGTNNISVVYTKPAIVNTPADGTITTAKLSGALVTPGTLDVNGQELILDADADTSITADTDDQIDIKISGADDFQFTANTFTALSGSTIVGAVDVNGAELILDADADTSITADTDDQIDVKIAGADDFRFTANNFNVLSGSTLTIDSGATITNSGTATNFGVDPESAYAGVLQTNANFVDLVIFGPSVDGRPWNGLWNKATVFSSLMLATIEDEGSNTEINVWDLTQQSAGAISTTPLATVDLASAATPTQIAACMGYLIVSSEDGIHIIDPHSGAWAERTSGWPKTLTTSTVPPINYAPIGVAAGFPDDKGGSADFDPRTGGPLPVFGGTFANGSAKESFILKDGEVWEITGGGSATGNAGTAIISGGRLLSNYDDDQMRQQTIDHFIANVTVNPPYMFTSNEFASIAAAADAIGSSGELTALGSGEGLGLVTFPSSSLGVTSGEGIDQSMNANITRAYNTGYIVSGGNSPVGVWLANSNTADRGFRANTLTNSGTVTEAAVESGAELKGYSGFSSSNRLNRTSDADWDVIGTGSAYLSVWFKSAGNSGVEEFHGFNNSGGTVRLQIKLNASGVVQATDDGATANNYLQSGFALDDGVWHKMDFVRVSSTERYLYVDGVFVTSSTSDSGSLSDSGNLPYAIGIDARDNSTSPATTCSLALAKLSTSRMPTARQIRQMYDAEKPMFVANAECLLQSGSTDAVLDVDVDPLTGKVLVTQTDAITVFKRGGLVVDSKPTVNSGNSEKGKLWGDLRVEQNSANIYVTAPAVDQRQVNEMVRGLANDLPAGADMSKAKAWCSWIGAGSPTIASSYNIKSITDNGVGDFTFNFAVPFKNDSYSAVGASRIASNYNFICFRNQEYKRTHAEVYVVPHSGSTIDDVGGTVLFFGELENE